jgi:hypothetical protein
MNYLFNMACYLAGPIDKAEDDGTIWRKELQDKSSIKGLGIKFLDPTNKPINIGQEIGEEKHKIKQLMANGRFEEAKDIMTKIRHYDLRMVDMSNFIIAFIDISTFMCGSFDEIFTAERQQKPVLILMKQKKNELPAWLISFIRPEEIFESIDDLVFYLCSINSGLIEIDNKRWVKI